MDNILDKTAPTMLHLLTEREAAILDAATHVRFGELLEVDIPQSDPNVSRKITAVQVAFIKTLRDEGLTRLDTIVIHNGTPSQIEIFGTVNNIKYKRKIRFN